MNRVSSSTCLLPQGVSNQTCATHLEEAGLTGTAASSNADIRTDIVKRRHSEFDHPLSDDPTDDSVIVDFDGQHDPYKPLNWPFHQKVVTTLLYSLTTMGASWTSSV